MTVLHPDGRVEGSLPDPKPEPVMYSPEEMKRDHPIAYRKAMQRAAEEHRKGMVVNLSFGNGKIKMLGK